MEIQNSNKANMYAWYQALKSGNYLQTTGELARRDEDGRMAFCCLGVACEVAIANGIDLTREGDEAFTYDLEDMVLPPKVLQWLGLSDANLPVGIVDPSVSDCDCSDCLGLLTATRANDGLHWTFRQIADGIYELYGLSEAGPKLVDA